MTTVARGRGTLEPGSGLIGRAVALLRAAVLLLVPLLAASQGLPSGALERQYLREASSGHLEHVLLFRHLYGYVALPRTFVMLERSSPDDVVFFVNPHTDSSLKEAGTVVPGVFLRHKDGSRRDVDTQHLLPSRPVHTEKRGDLTVDYFLAEGDWPSGSVMFSSGVYYLLLTGSAISLTDDMARAIVSLSGPPDVLSDGWHALGNWQELPSWSDATASSRGAPARR